MVVVVAGVRGGVPCRFILKVAPAVVLEVMLFLLVCAHFPMTDINYDNHHRGTPHGSTVSPVQMKASANAVRSVILLTGKPCDYSDEHMTERRGWGWKRLL